MQCITVWYPANQTRVGGQRYYCITLEADWNKTKGKTLMRRQAGKQASRQAGKQASRQASKRGMAEGSKQASTYVSK